MSSEKTRLQRRLERTKQRLELRQMERQLRLIEQSEHRAKYPNLPPPKQTQSLQENSEAWQWISGYSDVVDRFTSMDRDFVFPFSTAMDRRYGENWPFWRTWQEHARLRAASRLLWTQSPLAFGAINALASYVIGEGMLTKISPRDDNVTSDIVLAVQTVADKIAELNDWMSRQKECFVRARRDGEFFLRDFPQDDGMTEFRIVEPETVMEPPGKSREEASFGIITDPEDLLDVRGYWVAYNGVPGTGEYVHAMHMLHMKENVDEIIKRGLPDFAFDTQELYKVVSRLLKNMGIGAGIQSAIAFIRQHATAPTAAVEGFINSLADYDEQRIFTAQSQSVMRMEPGTIVDADANQTITEAPGAKNIPGYAQVVQSLLRAVAVRWNAPEWITSADSSNNNFASSLSAESPFVKSCRGMQARYARAFKHVMIHALQHYCRVRGGLRVGASKYTWDTLNQLIDVQVVPPTIETRNRQEEAMVNRTYVELGVKSRQTIAAELGLKWEVEERNNAAYEKEHPQGGAGGGGNPLAAMMGGGGGKPPGISSPDEPQGDDEQQGDDFNDLEQFLNELSESEPAICDLNGTLLLEARENWTSYSGPRGGKGWKNTKTGSIIYGELPPEADTGETIGYLRGNRKQAMMPDEEILSLAPYKTGVPGILEQISSKAIELFQKVHGTGKTSSQLVAIKDKVEESLKRAIYNRVGFWFKWAKDEFGDKVTKFDTAIELRGAVNNGLRRITNAFDNAFNNAFNRSISTSVLINLRLLDSELQKPKEDLFKKGFDLSSVKFEEDPDTYAANRELYEVLSDNYDHLSDKGRELVDGINEDFHERVAQLWSGIPDVIQAEARDIQVALHNFRDEVKLQSVVTEHEKLMSLSPEDAAQFKPKNEIREWQDPDSVPPELQGFTFDPNPGSNDIFFQGRKATKEEINAVHHYTGKGFNQLNELLRGGYPPDRRKVFTTHKHLQKLFAETKPSEKPINIYRGLSLDPEDMVHLLQMFQKSYDTGETISFKGYSSCSTDPTIAYETYSDLGGKSRKAGGSGNSVVFEIACRQGLNLGALSNDEPGEDAQISESEVLLNHNATFRVAGMSSVQFRNTKTDEVEWRTAIQLVQEVGS